MFESIGRSWTLAKQSLGVIRQDPELLLFPIVSFIAGVIVAGVLGGVGLLTGAFTENGVNLAGIILIFLFYFGTYFATIYFQVALVAAVKLRLGGGNPNLGYGVREANKRLGAITSWAVIAASVGLLLRLLDEIARRNTSGFGAIISQIILGLVGLAWSLATFFVIPIIAYEGVGGFEAIRRSAGIIKRRWGEAVVGHAGISLIATILAVVVAVVFGFLGLMILGAGGFFSLMFGIIFLMAAALGALFLISLGATLQSVYTAALYQHVALGQPSEAFSRDMLDTAFERAPARGAF